MAELMPQLVPMAAGLLAHDQTRVHPLQLAAVLARRAGSVATGVPMTTCGGRWPYRAGPHHRRRAAPWRDGVRHRAGPEPWVRVPQRLVGAT